MKIIRTSITTIVIFLSFPLLVHAQENPQTDSELEEYQEQEDKNGTSSTKPLYAIPKGEKKKRDTPLPFALGLSYTFWQPYLTGINVANSYGATDTKGQIVRPNTYAVSGVKVHGEVYTYHDDFRLKVNYTWFNFVPHTGVANLLNNDTVAYGSPFFGLPAEGLVSFSSKFKTQFNRLDAYFYKTVQVGEYLTFTQKAGLLGAWDMIRVNFDGTVQIALDDMQGRMSQFWWGIGPYGGGDLTFELFDHLGLYIGSGVAVLYAKHDIQQQNFLKNSEEGLNEAVANIKDYYLNVEPMIETNLGLCYRYDFDKVALDLNLAWQMQTYFMHIGFLKYFSGTGKSGDYSMQGLTAGATISF